jgi:hypothetical protein
MNVAFYLTSRQECYNCGMKKLLYIIFGIIILVAIFVFVRNLGEDESVSKSGAPTPVIATSTNPLSLTYTIDDSLVTLVNGVSEETLPDSSSTETTEVFGAPAFGDLTADGKPDVAMIVAQYGGGTGQFFYVTVAILTSEGYRGMDSVFIGDRIAPQNLLIEKSGRIVVNYADRGADEPFSEQPSVAKTLYLVYNNTGKGGLVVSK